MTLSLFSRFKDAFASFRARAISNQHGSTLIYVVGAMVIMSVLGTGIVRLTTTSTFTEITQDSYQQARYLAESGFNYAPHFFTGINVCSNYPDLLEKKTIILNMGNDDKVEFKFSDIQKTGTTITFENFEATGFTNTGTHVTASKYKRTGTRVVQCSGMQEYFFASMKKETIDEFIDKVLTSDPEAWDSGEDGIYKEKVTEGVVLTNKPNIGREQLIFVLPMELKDDCKDYIVRSIAWIDLENKPSSGGYGYAILFDSRLTLVEDDGEKYKSDIGYSFQFDPGYSDGEMLIRERYFSSGKLEEPVRRRYNNRSFLPTTTDTDNSQWWQDLHYIMLRVTDTPYLRRVTATVFDIKESYEYDMDTITVFDTEDPDSPWERRFSFSYFYDFKPGKDEVLYTGLRGWGVPTYFHYLSVEPLACEPFIVTGAIAEYLFEEDDNPGRDTSGIGYDGSPEGGFTTSQKIMPAYMDGEDSTSTCSYATFNGTDSGLNMGVVPLDMKDEMTVMAWVRKDGAHKSNWANIVTSARASGTNGRFWLQHNQNNTKYEFAVSTAQTRTYILSNSAPSNSWQHVAGVYDGSTIKMYVDGELENEANLTGDIVAHSDNFLFSIGRDAGGRRFKGNIDEVRVFNRAMNSVEINDWRVETRPCGWAPPETGEFVKYIMDNNVFVYGNALEFKGNNVTGHGATVVIKGNLNTSDLGGGNHINVSHIYIDGSVDLDGGSASLGSNQIPGNIYINKNTKFWNGGRDIYGDVYINGNFQLKDAKIHGNVYVNGNLVLGDTPTLSPETRIYYTGSISHPTSYDSTILEKCIPRASVPGFEIPDFVIPGPRPDQWYADRGYVSSGTLVSGLKIFADSYSSTVWRPTAENVVIVSKGDITITGLGGSGLTGVLYAPYGKVTFKGNSFEGTVIARDGFFVTSGGTNVTFKKIEDFFPDAADDIPIGNQ